MHLINYAQTIAYRMLFDYPLFKAAELAGSNKISVLIVGAGFVGMEVAKAALWAGQMKSFAFEITIVDIRNTENDFNAPGYDLNERLKDADVRLNYSFVVADVNSNQFKEIIRAHNDANYIVVALGNDELTLNTSVALRRELIRSAVENGTYDGKIRSLIIPVIMNELYAALLTNLNEDGGFQHYGSNSQIFRLENIGYSGLDKMATYINWNYDRNYEANLTLQASEEKYKRLSEINKRSSRAAAIRALYNLKDVGVDCVISDETFENEITVAQADSLLRAADLQELEHKRWTIFMAINGWNPWKLHADDDYVSIEKYDQNVHKLTAARLHGCMIRNDQLDKISEAVPSAGRGDTLRKNDVAVINASAKALDYAFGNMKFLRQEEERLP
ncbi:MAG: hypothetical protein IKD72_06100 [Clostridia bacterium]|nr:hypothetical protein [Clostridia bacterium]